jgi:uncharacterized membrane protein YjdF
MIKITKSLISLLIVDIVYLIIFSVIFLKRGNIEFMIYTGAVFFLLIVILLLHLKFNFSYITLMGLSLIGLMHMIGGGVIVNGLRMYGHYIVLGIIRYDKIVHFLGIFFAVFIFYELIKKNKINKIALSIILFLAGVGIGTVWEIMEFILVTILPETGVGGYVNTMGDIVANSIGAITAVFFIYLNKKNN